MKNKYKENIKRMLAIGIFSVLILAMIMIVIPNDANAATTHYVGQPGSGATYTSIQSAINAASNGDTIRVWAGTYTENVVVNKILSVIGNGSSATIVDGNNGGTVISITTNWVNITDLTVKKSGNNWNSKHCGIKLNSVDNVTIEGVNSTDNLVGIIFLSSKDCTIQQNCHIFENDKHGIYMYQSDENEIDAISIYDNDDDNNNDGDGINMSQSDNNLIENNIIENSFGGNGNQQYGIFMEESDGNTIGRGNNILRNKVDGVYLDKKCDDNLIENNIISSNDGNGISLNGDSTDHPKDNTINNINDIQDNGDNGIYLYYSGASGNDNVIDENYISGNSDSGIYLEYSDYNEIKNNDIIGHSTNGKAGVQLYDSDSNTIEGNDIGETNDGNYYGIYLDSNSDSNTIDENIIKDSSSFGVNIDDANSDSNEIYHNDFYSNNGVGVQGNDDTGNTWDDNIGEGNYWDDYQTRYPMAQQDITGTYWLTPYAINGGTSQDNYPLINPYN
jgi:parallel beta-helix repeat protein